MDVSEFGILIVDDEFSVRDCLQSWFRKDGFRTATAENATAALRQLQEGDWDIVLLDIKMPGMDGIELQRRIHEIDPDIVVIMITAYASAETAVQALKQGAFDYVTKPIDPDELSHLVRKALEKRRPKAEKEQVRAKTELLAQLDEIVGESPPMLEVLDLIRSVAPTDTTVLIHGESGTGKKLVSHAIHAGSNRRYFPIVPANCGTLPENLVESDLFGHEKGAFPGAQYRRKGKIEMADGGTLFLDEVGTISAKTQAELLRILETKEFTRLGGNRSQRVDFRVICSTNRNLEELVAQGLFREDLYYLLKVFSIHLPPLRERRSDIPLLVNHFLQCYAQPMSRPAKRISPEAMEILVQADWPGNVRQLANAVERAMVASESPVIQPADLPLQLADGSDAPGVSTLADVERAHCAQVLEQTEWNIDRAARMLGIDKTTLCDLIEKYGLSK
jgi:DNA-binding NtrC family response regulator